MQNLDGNIDRLLINAALAQLDRASDYESEGRGFESLMPHQEVLNPRDVSRGFVFSGQGEALSSRFARCFFKLAAMGSLAW